MEAGAIEKTIHYEFFCEWMREKGQKRMLKITNLFTATRQGILLRITECEYQGHNDHRLAGVSRERDILIAMIYFFSAFRI